MMNLVIQIIDINQANNVAIDLCYYNETYIVVKGTVIVTDPNNDAYDTKLALKNNAHLLASY